jgi:DNA-binding NarL/FixJ family response regulator
MLRVLIADDSREIRSRLVDLVSVLDGVQVVREADDGTEVLEALAEIKIDVLVLDIKMPKMSGIKVLEHLQQSGELPETVIVLTAFPTPQYRRRCLELGAGFFLDKTSEYNRLAQLLRAVRDAREDAP